MTEQDLCPSRRSMISAMLGVAVVPAVLAGCSESGPKANKESTVPNEADSKGSQGGAGQQMPTSTVAVGQATVVDVNGEKVVLAQPTAGNFVAYDAACTHKGTVVTSTKGMTLTCPAHGSVFDARDGSVKNGPAETSLISRIVTVSGDSLTIS